MSSIFKEYKKFVVQNIGFIEPFERLGRFAVLFLINGDNEVFSEASYTVFNLISQLHEYILADAKKIHQRIQEDPRFKLFYHVSMPMKFLGHVQVMFEMILVKLKVKNKWSFILLIEVIQSLIKLWTIYKSKINMYINHTVLPSDKQMDYEHLMNTAKTSHAIQQQLRQSGMQPQDMMLMDTKFMDRNALKPHKRLSLIFGEVIHAIRPVVYVLLIMKYGLMSWKPWTTSLAVDAVGIGASVYGLSKPFINEADNVENFRGMVVRDELARRIFALFYYLAKTPFFDRYFAPFLRSLPERFPRLPGIKTIVENHILYMLALQTYYFYTA